MLGANELEYRKDIFKSEAFDFICKYKQYLGIILVKNDLNYTDIGIGKKIDFSVLDRDASFECIKRCGYCLLYCHPTFTNEMMFVAEAMKTDPVCLKYASEFIRGNLLFLSPYLDSKIIYFKYILWDLRNNKEFLKPYIKRNGYVIEYLPQWIQYDESILMDAIENDPNILLTDIIVNESWKTNETILKKAVLKEKKFSVYLNELN